MEINCMLLKLVLKSKVFFFFQNNITHVERACVSLVVCIDKHRWGGTYVYTACICEYKYIKLFLVLFPLKSKLSYSDCAIFINIFILHCLYLQILTYIIKVNLLLDTVAH